MAGKPKGQETDDFSELYDARIERVDLVKGAANGHKFLFAKSAAESMIPADEVRDLIAKSKETPVTAAAAPTEPIAKDVEVGDLIEATPAGSTADSVPGSTDWEEKDGDSALNIISVLGRVKAAVEFLAGREATEGSVTNDWDAWDNEWDLQDASAAIDYAIDMLAPYAAGEKLEAEMDEELAGIVKAVAAISPSDLATLESLTAIKKSGRVLSSANETTLREASASAQSAIESIEKVLAALPAAPVVEETVEKGTTVTDDTKTDPEGDVTKTGATPDAKVTDAAPEPVEKADAPEDGEKSAQVLVYDADGNIIGSVDPSEITTFANTPAGAAGGDAEDVDAAAAGTEPAATDLTPEPSGDAGTAANATADQTVTKGTSQPETEGDPVELLLKQAEDGDDEGKKALAEIVKGLQAEVKLYKSLPATPGVIANGGPLPTEANLRGQNDGAPDVDANEVGALRKSMAEASTPAEREAAANALQALATQRLSVLHSAPGSLIGGR